MFNPELIEAAAEAEESIPYSELEDHARRLRRRRRKILETKEVILRLKAIVETTACPRVYLRAIDQLAEYLGRLHYWSNLDMEKES